MENAVRTGNKMSQAETLISEYDLKDWFNPGYTGPDSLRKCLPALKDKYRGLQRIGTNPAATAQAQAAANSAPTGDRKSTRLNSSHVAISYAVFCLKKKIKNKLYISFLYSYYLKF